MRCNYLSNGLVSLALLGALATPATVAHAQKQPILVPAASSNPTALPRIVFGNATLPIATPQSTPFRDTASDGALCISPDALAPLGITYIVDEMMRKVSLLGPDGVVSVTVPMRTPPSSSDSKGVFVPVVEVVEALGGKCEWEAATNTLHLRARLLEATMTDGQLRVRASLPVTPKVTTDNGGRLVIVDIPGSEVGALPKQLTLNAPGVRAARTGQFDDDTARIVLEMAQPSGFLVTDARPSTQLVLNPSLTTPAAPPKAIAKATTKPASPNALPAASVVKGISVKKVSDTQAQIVVTANRAPGVRAGLSRNRLTLDLLNSSVAASAASVLSSDHPLLKGVALAAAQPGTPARLVLDLARAVNYTVKPLANGTLIVDLMLPKSAGGKLAGKLVAVDAGHGGSDSGAKGVNGTYEKNVNMAIALKVAETLREQGANVLLTRASDTFIDVSERPRIANRAGADFFISVHSDSGTYNHSVNGSTVYYHMDWASCRTLAQCVADRFREMGGIRTKGTHSDAQRFGGRFVNGYGVLRGSRMVAILVECGYMTHSGDVSRLNDPTMQKKIANSIVSGLRDYIEGNPDFDTRFINPNAVGGLPDGGGNDVPVEPDPSTMPVEPGNGDATPLPERSVDNRP
jgi:N-acetylmuramoyl-L-alanine amidase